MFCAMRRTNLSNRDEYCRLIRRYFRLRVRETGMRGVLTDQELDESKQYALVMMQTEAVKRRLDEIISEFDLEDFHAVFRRIDN